MNAHSIRIVIRLHRAYIGRIELPQSEGDVNVPLNISRCVCHLFSYVTLLGLQLPALTRSPFRVNSYYYYPWEEVTCLRCVTELRVIYGLPIPLHL